MNDRDDVAQLKATLAAPPFATILEGQGHFGLAVSGGPDSLALLLLAERALPGHIAAATVDHQLRPESRAEAEMVASLCADLGVPHDILTVEVAKGGSGTQANARIARYDALADWAGQRGLAAVATAHHLDDQAETLLMRANRGSGLGGLAGIRPVTLWRGKLALIRPLLGWRRSTLENFVRDAHIHAVDDPSNRDTAYDRSRMRALIAREVELDAVRLARTAAALQDADDALSWSAARVLAEKVQLNAKGLELFGDDLPHYFQRRIVEHAVRFLVPDAAPLRGQEVENVVVALNSGGKTTLRGTLFTGGRPWKAEIAPPAKSRISIVKP